MKPLVIALLIMTLAAGVALEAMRPAVVRAANPDPVAGNAASPVRVIIYQDLECPDCAQWHGVFERQIIPEFGGRVGFEFRDFPLPQHLWSFNAAVLARYFDTRQVKIGLAWRDYCFTHQDQLTPANLLDTAAQWARPYGISEAELTAVFGRQDLFQKVMADEQRGKQDNVEHTPTVLLNGVEATTPEQLTQMLKQALAGR